MSKKTHLATTENSEISLMPKFLRLYFIGLMMGIADLIPGISGGTVAFMSGIYEELLMSIKTLRIQSFKKIAWPFLLFLGSGIVTSILLFANFFYYLLSHYHSRMFAFFFGLIAASSVLCAKDAKMKKIRHFVACFLSAALSFWLTFMSPQLFFGSSFLGFVCAAMLATGAMLLPGISGSFVLQLIGVYPLVIYALTTPFTGASCQLLAAMTLGIAIGFVLFARIISFLLSRFRQMTLSILVGCMAGGLKTLWPFTSQQEIILPTFLILSGFSVFIYLNIKVKKSIENSSI